MTRGKHGQAAAVRQEVQTRDAEIATYQRRVAQLTAENRSLRDQLQGEQQRHREVERRLRAEREAGVSPKVEALEALIARRTEERDTARQRCEILDDLYRRMFLRLGDHFRSAHRLHGTDVGEAVLALLVPETAGTVLVVDSNTEAHIGSSKVSPEMLKALVNRQNWQERRIGKTRSADELQS